MTMLSRRAFLSTCSGLGAAALAGCAPASGTDDDATPDGGADGPSGLTKVSFVLDYSPNVNHTGIYVAIDQGFFAKEGIEVEIVPGASAINTCAALVGAPLTHDFCAISLSDLLTPWPTIARRLNAVAYADFVVALYNPKSGRRTRQIEEAQRIFLQYRDPQTPVAIVKSAFRPKQRIQFTTLEKMTEAEIGMLTTVLIGNSNTYVKHGLMITPRGYANKYGVSGEGRVTHEGEKAGRSLSSGLDGWLQSLREDLAAGHSLQALAARDGLPADYLQAALADPPEDAAAAETGQD